MSDRLTAEQVGELERLEAKATQGPWEVDGQETEGSDGKYNASAMIDLEGRTIFESSNSHLSVIHEDGPDDDGFYSRWDETARRNFDLLAALRNHAPSLLATAKREAEQAAEIERLTARVRELEAVRTHAEQLVYIISQWRSGGLRIGACKQAEDKLIEAIARTALGKEERTAGSARAAVEKP